MARDAFVITNEEEYRKALQSFYSHSTQLEVSVGWVKDKMPDIIRRNTSTISGEPFRVLAIGTGDGNPYDDELLEILSKLNMKVHYTVVEPRADAIDVFRERVEKKYKNTQFKWIPATFENYQDSEWIKDGQKFNLIHFIHSLYYFVTSFESLRARLRPCYADMLQDGGSMIILVSQNENKLYYPQWPMNVYYFDSSDVVRELALHEGWNHDHFEQNFQVDLTECFDPDSCTGGYLLDFLTLTVNFRKNADRDQLNQVMKYLHKESEMMEDGRKIASRCKIVITVIWKD